MFIVSGSGRLTGPVVVRDVGKSKIGNLSLCYNRNFKKDNEWVSVPTFLDLECYDKLTEHVGKFEKGDTIEFYGELQQENWVDKKTGAHRSKLTVRAGALKKVQAKSHESNNSEGSESPENVENSESVGSVETGVGF